MNCILKAVTIYCSGFFILTYLPAEKAGMRRQKAARATLSRSIKSSQINYRPFIISLCTVGSLHFYQRKPLFSLPNTLISLPTGFGYTATQINTVVQSIFATDI